MQRSVHTNPKTEKLLAKLPHVDCAVCKPDIEAYYDLSAEIVRLNRTLMGQAAWAPGKQMIPGRIVALHDGVSCKLTQMSNSQHFPGNIAIILRNAPSIVREGVKSDAKAFWVLALVTKSQLSGKQNVKDDEVPPRWPPVLPPGKVSDPRWELTAVDSSSVAFVTNRLFKVDHTSILDKRSKEVSLKTAQELAKIQEELTSGDMQEFDWGRLTKLEFQDILRQRIAFVDRVSKLGCQLCDNFEDHVSLRVSS